MTEIPVHPDSTVPLEITVPRELTYYRINSVDTDNDEIIVEGDKRDKLPDGGEFDIIQSTGNDGTYTISSTDYKNYTDTTKIIVDESINNSTPDGIVSGSSAELLVGEDENPSTARITRASGGTTDIAAPLSAVSLSGFNTTEIKWKLKYIDGTVEILPPSGDILNIQK
jgi:hypothetical protein